MMMRMMIIVKKSMVKRLIIRKVKVQRKKIIHTNIRNNQTPKKAKRKKGENMWL
jgi:hypothetical protein